MTRGNALRRTAEGRPIGIRGKEYTERRKVVGVEHPFTEKELYDVELLAKLGATNKQIALYFKVDVTVVEFWLRNNEEFSEARKRGGMEADMKVAESLYRRAVGYSYVEKEYQAVTDPITGKKISMDQMLMVKKTRKHVSPDVKAAIHWLKMRQRDQWQATVEFNHNVKGSVQHMHRALKDIPVSELSKDAQEVVFEITRKQMQIEQDAEGQDDSNDEGGK
jgi:hypothetical protein